METLYTGV
ncbi:unnamed protein product [Allacma fusca]|uniref:Uncharacterized protein n=1 Tax=Allacma fusca TaxID=39272 RepID=A0A8J2J732_9HEXA|nr:unnamed protein product [Allacma fusca]